MTTARDHVRGARVPAGRGGASRAPARGAACDHPHAPKFAPKHT